MIRPADDGSPAGGRAARPRSRGGTRRVAALGASTALAALLGIAACEGSNLFEGGGTGRFADLAPPTVDLRQPGASTTFPQQDSVLVEVALQDNVGVSTVEITGVAFRGDPELGTDRVVPRYGAKNVTFEKPVRDTVLLRYLSPIPEEGGSEVVAIAVTARDSAGNAGTDTVRIVVGGPRVEIQSPLAGQQVQAGRALGVRVFASDPAGITRVQLEYEGVANGSVLKTYSPARESVLVDTAIILPQGVSGSLRLSASAENAQTVVGRAAPVLLSVGTAVQADTLAPTVSLSASALTRTELTDAIRASIVAEDNPGGTGIARIGITALAYNTASPDTVTRSVAEGFAPARTGRVVRELTFPPFHVDSLALPDTVVYEIHAFAIDSAGNCGATVLPSAQRTTCATVDGNIVALGLLGQRLSTVVVTGRTILLPDSGIIADAVVDVPRERLYLSNFSLNKVELLDLRTMEFAERGVLVGSEPWGLFMNGPGDTLMVANSGGTNVSFVSLAGTPAEDAARRLLTPNAVLYEVAINLDQLFRERYTVSFIDFSDRPQFVVQDSTGRLLYSTVPTGSAPDGTIRYVISDPVPSSTRDKPEVKLLFTDAAVVDAQNIIAIGHVDSLNAYTTDDGDLIEIFDHHVGFPDSIIRSGITTIGNAIAQMVASGSDIYARTGRWSVAEIGLSDTTYLAASGDRGWVAFGEGATAPTGRIILWNAALAGISDEVQIVDLISNASERVFGVDLNVNGSLGVARGQEAAYFFTNDLRLQGIFREGLENGGAGAAFHPDHTSVVASDPTTIAFVGTSRHTIKVMDTFHFFRVGEVHIRDNVVGPLRASPPLPGDNAGLSCPADDRCIAVKLFGITDAGGVVVVDVRQRDLR